jgi:hypothetical protein
MPGLPSKKVSAAARAKLIAFAKTQDKKRKSALTRIVADRAKEISAALGAMNKSRLTALKKVRGVTALQQDLTVAQQGMHAAMVAAGRDAQKRRKAWIDGYSRITGLLAKQGPALAQALKAAERQRYASLLGQLATLHGNFTLRADLLAGAVLTSADDPEEPPAPFTLEPPYADEGTSTLENVQGLGDPLQFTFADSGDFLSSAAAVDVGACDATLMLGSFFSAPRGDFTFRIRPKLSTNFDLNATGVGGLSYASYLFVAELVEADDGFSQLQTKFVREVIAPVLWHADTSGSETRTVLFRFPSPGPGGDYLIRVGVKTTTFSLAPFGLGISSVDGTVKSIGVEIV